MTELWNSLQDTEHGQIIIKAMGLEDIFVEVDLTPNRPDCASVIGIAREIAGVVRKPLTLPVQDSSYRKAQAQNFPWKSKRVELCPRYAGRLIKRCKNRPISLVAEKTSAQCWSQADQQYR